MEAFIPSGFSIFVIAIVILAIVMIRSGIKQVPQAQEWTVERFGKYTHTMRPGLNLLIPFVDKVGFKLSLRETVLDIPPQDVISYDNATITADGVAFYQIVDPAKAAYEVRDLERALTNLSLTNLRTVIGSMSLDDVLSKRDVINDRLLRVIDEASNAWGIKVNRVEIKDLSPPDDLVEAMGRQMKAEREKRAEILTAEGDKQSAILRAEGQKQSAILEAEGRREAAYRDAEAREREAEAEAKATAMVSTAISKGNVQAINYFVAQSYIETLGKFANSPNQKILMLPVEAASVIGAIGGIVEIAREAFGGKDGDGDGSTPPRRSPGGSGPSGGATTRSAPGSTA